MTALSIVISKTYMMHPNYNMIQTQRHNGKKTYQCHFTQTNAPYLELHNKRNILHGHILQTETATKYLGITIQSDLKWNKHINNIT